ncbi:Fe-S cluster assembly ATPase SufC [Candidatus Parcubacteria bacterium]|nr:Fe-S cluster assembly ATPase SufC [Candidatus Parcubacteria bacterium]
MAKITNDSAARTFSIQNLTVSVEGRTILHSVSLELKKGEVHVLMGPNGSGKSTLAYALMGHPRYKMERGRAMFKGKNILKLAPDERARLGLFLSFQQPVAVSGLVTIDFLRSAHTARFGGNPNKPTPLFAVKRAAAVEMAQLAMPEEFLLRALNEGFSGGERKKSEVLQMAVLKPEFVILDEADTGLDVSALKIVARRVQAEIGSGTGALVITHFPRILRYLKPTKVHVMMAGRIVKSGGPNLAHQIEQRGYEHFAGQAKSKIKSQKSK